MTSLVEDPRDRPEAFLPTGVPNLQLHYLSTYSHSKVAKFNSDGGIVVFFEGVLDQPTQEAALSHA